MPDLKATPTTLRDELRAVLNRLSAENTSSTPDYLLPELLGCLWAFEDAVNQRDKWHRGKAS